MKNIFLRCLFSLLSLLVVGATSDTVFFFDEAGTSRGFVATVSEKVVVSVYGSVGGSLAITARENAPVSLTLGQLTNGSLLQGTGLACWF